MVMASPQRHPRPSPAKPADQARQHLQAAPRHSRRLMPLVGWAAAITVVVSLFALALFHAMIVDRQTTLDSLNEQLEDAQAVNDRLRLNVSRAEAPDRIVAEALYRLGMVEPDQLVYLAPVELDEGGTK